MRTTLIVLSVAACFAVLVLGPVVFAAVLVRS